MEELTLKLSRQEAMELMLHLNETEDQASESTKDTVESVLARLKSFMLKTK